jgi:CubicO group peptidase (beta-lactamase class C family)
MSAEILGVLIARVSGMALSVFMHERIFEPLGMATARREARRASVFPFFGSRVIST